MYKFYYTNGYGVTSYIRKSMASLWQITWNPNIRKWLMRINLTWLMLLIAFMQVSLAAKAQKISLSKKNAPLTEIFKELRKQSGYDFVINKDQIKIAKPVSLSVNDDDLVNVLTKCFENQPFTYLMEDKMIIVVNKKPEKVKVGVLPIDVKGRLVDENGSPLVGASISVKGSERKTITNEKGEFSLTNIDDRAFLVISFVGYEVKEISAKSELGTIKMFAIVSALDEIQIVNTGYQKLPKERMTGSFVYVDRELIERSVSTNILTRLQDVVPGMIFNRNRSASNLSGEGNISIRGQSTIFGNTQPLIILDNFPYDGDLANINPNDIENISVLKDAAASSIWGARAGNGVIVLTSKRAKAGQALVIAANTNLSYIPQPNLLKNQNMSSGDFIDLEKILFSRGFYNGAENSVVRTPLTPVVELLISERDGKISTADADRMIQSLKGYDIREQYMRYMGNSVINQQYAVNASGDGNNNSYYLSIGYDHNRLSDKLNYAKRLNMNFNDRLRFLDNKLEVSVGLLLTRSINERPNNGFNALSWNLGDKVYPYARLVDQMGNPAAIVKDYRMAFSQTALSSGYLDWEYRPVEDMEAIENRAQALDYRINTNAKYRIATFLEAEAAFQYGRNSWQQRMVQGAGSYYTRNLINRFTQIVAGGTNVYPVPIGAILDQSVNNSESFNFRGQLNYRKTISGFEIAALGGYEWRDLSTSGYSNRYYGYNDDIAQVGSVNYVGVYPVSYYLPGSSGTGSIPVMDGVSGTTDRFLSFYSNASVSFKSKYVLSGSARLDRSNIFGVNSNQKGVPLWSAGLLWNLSKEDFYGSSGSSLFPMLSIKASFGYNGNIDRNTSAFTTASYFSGSSVLTRQNYAAIINPPNPDLRWERVKVANLGIDFIAKDHRISGTLEFYRKSGLDLIGEIPYAPSSGITSFRGNVANTRVSGVDLSLNTVNTNGNFKWTTSFWASYNDEIVTKYVPGPNANVGSYTLQGDAGIIPIKGYPLYSMFSYKWAGLNQLGDPQGFLKGTPSADYTSIFAASTLDNIVFSGSAKPKAFGSLINNLSFKGFNFSANLTYRLGYYFRRNSINYSQALSGKGGHMDFSARWKQPGDESLTQIPALPSSSNTNRDNMYLYSDVLVEKGDHIRLQDLRMGYQFPNKLQQRFGVNHMEVFTYLSNLGLIWSANKKDIDPDYVNGLAPEKSFAIGVKFNF
ncbi:SusC/RagA family TonB-linked outer membrane protein [Pedobacter heparinus]|uniref:TonB-dependent receptor plug n=2 Tax=Pedobacter heparinus TaxID=984 RepID=C6Y2V9_PEDHD|nr:SusC/RagA family TonB-linked outer membrane protein [Pedobacter heparinus]ACU03172.1 TonB-dependent receptor plug [Pedobacter heparinus DSM 2366]